MKTIKMIDYIHTLKKGDLVYNRCTKKEAKFSHLVTPAICQSGIMVFLEGDETGYDLFWIQPGLKNKVLLEYPNPKKSTLFDKKK